MGKSSARSTLSILATKLVILPFTVITGIIVAKLLGPNERGIYIYILLISNFVLPLFSLGFGNSVVFFISNKGYKVNDVSLTIVLSGFFYGLICSFVMYALWNFGLLGETVRSIPAFLMIPVLLSLPFTSTNYVIERVFIGTSNFTQYNIISFGRQVLTVLLLWSLVVFAGLQLYGAVASIIITIMFVFIYQMLTLFRKYKFGPRVNKVFLIDSFRYGIKVWYGSVATTINSRMDQFLLGTFSKPINLGNYSVAVNIAEFILIIPNSLDFVFFNRIAGEKDLKKRILLTQRVHKVLFTYMLGAGIIVGILGWQLITVIYGEEYSGAVIPFLLYLPAVIVYITTKILTKYFSASGKPMYSSMIQIIISFIGIPLYIFMTYNYESIGAALSNSILGFFSLVTTLLFFKKFIYPDKMYLFNIRLNDLIWGYNQVVRALKKNKRA